MAFNGIHKLLKFPTPLSLPKSQTNLPFTSWIWPVSLRLTGAKMWQHHIRTA